METISTLTYKELLEEALDNQRKSETQKARMNASLELHVLDCDEEKRSWVDYSYELKECHLNPYGGIHGGVACALADTCGGVAIAMACGRMPSTTDLSCSYIRPMLGKSFRIRVDITQIGNKLAACNCSIYDRDGDKLCVTCMLKYILLNRVAEL